LAILGLISLAGCGDRPRAPALRDAPVYVNDREGFRFLVPKDWLQSASGQLPPGQLDGEVLLVQYKMRTPGRGAQVEVLCFDDAENTDLHEYHAGPSHGQAKWRSTVAPEQLDVNGTPAERFVYEAPVGRDKMVKEVVAFRQKGRVYSFIGLFWSTDEKARQQLRRAVADILWR
jgi:hypothetical protein